VAIQLPGTHVGEIAVPHHVGLLGQRDRRRRRGRIRRVEETELYAGSVGRKDGEVHPDAGPGRPEGKRLTWPDAHGFTPASKKLPAFATLGTRADVLGDRGGMASARKSRSWSWTMREVFVIHPDGHTSADLIPGARDPTTLTHREPGAI